MLCRQFASSTPRCCRARETTGGAGPLRAGLLLRVLLFACWLVLLAGPVGWWPGATPARARRGPGVGDTLLACPGMPACVRVGVSRGHVARRGRGRTARNMIGSEE